jgi:hypothetical protein
MNYFFDPLQQAALQHQQWGALGSTMFNPAMSQAFGQPYGQVGQFGQLAHSASWPTWGMQPASQPIAPQSWQQPWQQRQFTPQDLGDVVRLLVPLLPQILAQAQPAIAAIHAGYGAFGLQNPFAQNPFAQNPWAQATFAGQNPFAPMVIPQLLQQQPFGQPGWPQVQSAFGGTPNWSQRTLTPNDVNDVVRQLVTIIPQAIGNLQTLNQQRVV